MAFDFKKEYKEFYLPPRKPEIISVPPMQYAAVDGSGDPNAADGAFQRAIQCLYTLAFTIKMSKMGSHRMAGYFDFVVPPLEGFWGQEGTSALDLSRKDAFQWTAVLRLPDFVTPDEFDWAKAQAMKKADCSAVHWMPVAEGTCVQMLHVGAYDDEIVSVQAMEAFIQSLSFRLDCSDQRRHHEIYLSDARRVAPEKRRTVLRLPIAPQ